MAGSDTFRGCSFQAAFCVSLGLEVLQGAAEVLVVEGDEDIVDASLEDASGAAQRIIQAKTKAEPYSWQPQEIANSGSPGRSEAERRGPPASSQVQGQIPERAGSTLSAQLFGS